MPNNSSVFGLGVAVNAKVETFGRRPRFSISARIRLSSASSGVSASLSSDSAAAKSSVESTDLRLLVLSPVWDECASSTITAKRLPGSSPICWAITENFWRVLTMMVLPLSSASLS